MLSVMVPGYCGWHNANRTKALCVASPKAAKVSKAKVAIASIFTKKIQIAFHYLTLMESTVFPDWGIFKFIFYLTYFTAELQHLPSQENMLREWRIRFQEESLGNLIGNIHFKTFYGRN